jgi:hypothetical protein
VGVVSAVYKMQPNAIADFDLRPDCQPRVDVRRPPLISIWIDGTVRVYEMEPIELGELEEAKREIQKVLDKDLNNSLAQTCLYLIYSHEGRNEDVIKLLNKTVVIV